MHLRPIPFATAAWSILGAVSLALALPLLGTLGAGPTFFVAHVAGGFDVALFALGIWLAVPALLCLLAAVLGARRCTGISAVFVSAVVAAAVGIWLLTALKPLAPAVAIAIAAALGVAAGVCFFRDLWVRPPLVVIGQISLAIPLYFLLFTPVSSLLYSGGEGERDVASGVIGGNNSTPVVILVLDELPTAALLDAAGELDSLRFPNFARLQAMSTWYRNTTTVSTNTHLAISAIHSGRRPDAATLPIPGQLPQNIFSLLAPTHRVYATESVSRLCTPALCESHAEGAAPESLAWSALLSDAFIVWLHTLLPQSLADEHLPSIAGQWRDFRRDPEASAGNAGRSINAAMTDGFDAKHASQWQLFLSRMSEEGATLNYLHLGLPHHPWIYLPDGALYNGRETPATTYTHDWRPRPVLVAQASLRFAMQMEYVDSLIGQMLDELEEQGTLEESLVMVLSDHGLTIAPSAKRRAPLAETFVDVAAVPLFIKYPRQAEGLVDDRVVETIDILPTLARALNIPLFDHVDGQALNGDEWVQVERQVVGAAEAVLTEARDLDFSGAAARFTRWLLPGKTALESWAEASGGAFFGESVDDLARAAPEVSFTLDRPEWYTNVSSDSGFLPLRLTGKLNGAERGAPVYIALNGRIAGGSEVHDRRGAISVMLHPDAFQQGTNRVEAFVLQAGELARVESRTADSSQWTVRRSTDGGIELRDAAGRQFVQGAGKAGSAVISREPPLVAIVGRAFDTDNNVSPDVLLLVDGERIATDRFQAYPGREAHDPMAEALVSTFTLELTAQSVPPGGSLSVLAVWNDGTFLPISVTDNTDLFQ